MIFCVSSCICVLEDTVSPKNNNNLNSAMMLILSESGIMRLIFQNPKRKTSSQAKSNHPFLLMSWQLDYKPILSVTKPVSDNHLSSTNNAADIFSLDCEGTVLCIQES